MLGWCWIYPLQICGVVQKEGSQPCISEWQLHERPLHRREEIAVVAQWNTLCSITVKRTAAVPRNVRHAGTARGERSASLGERRVGREECCRGLCAHLCVQHLWVGARIQAWVEALGQDAGSGAWVGRLPGRSAGCSLCIARWFMCWCCSSGFFGSSMEALEIGIAFHE